ncbi:MAG: YlcI/YnfO family protein [Pelagibacterium sp.]|jgi:predicted transcriptional regulator|uniref:YlcI/YnfO family protein n=1 Tax=Pelagibacterium sp. TaxID=1967288 RepID=UPI0032EB3CA9|tara:strand:- start:1319 stop:1591 length:273 start_codon:yes stop_codon:yes gene_type:complete
MKTSTLPSLRVDPELRKAAEDILDDGQTLSSFIEEAVRHEVQRRKIRRDFLKKALAAEAEAEATGTYYSAEQVLEELREIIDKAEEKKVS